MFNYTLSNWATLNLLLAYGAMLTAFMCLAVFVIRAVRYVRRVRPDRSYYVSLCLRCVGLLLIGGYYGIIIFFFGGQPNAYFVPLSRFGEIIFLVGSAIYVVDARKTNGVRRASE
jgi:hypothetical protein